MDTGEIEFYMKAFFRGAIYAGPFIEFRKLTSFFHLNIWMEEDLLAAKDLIETYIDAGYIERDNQENYYKITPAGKQFFGVVIT